MIKRSVRGLRVFSYFIITYMLIASAWWSFLLFTKNNDAFEAKAQLLAITLVAEKKYLPTFDVRETSEYQNLKAKYDKQEYMIFGEACAFVLILFGGVWFINRGYNQEVEAAQQRRNFLLSITHELKSPIASIRLILETFLKRSLRKDQIDQFSIGAIKEADRLNSLVTDLLLSAKLDTAYTPHFEKLNLVALFEELIDKLSMKYPNGIFNFEHELEEEWINVDKTGITSVAINLLENAVKYSNENPVIKATLSQENDKHIIKISDQGIGISDKEKKNIYKKFYRIGNEDTRNTKGTGLGLFIVKEIIAAHKGTIKVADNTPKGTQFIISLPDN